jgi:outer membrane biosynthesis protein TonB
MYGSGAAAAGVLVFIIALLPSIAMLVLSIIMIVKYFKLCGDVRRIAEYIAALSYRGNLTNPNQSNGYTPPPFQPVAPMPPVRPVPPVQPIPPVQPVPPVQPIPPVQPAPVEPVSLDKPAPVSLDKPGESESATQTCEHCGAVLQPGALFCENCGSTV